MRISDWSSDVCSSDLRVLRFGERLLSGVDIDLPRRIGDMRDLRVAGFRRVMRQSGAADGQRRRGAGPDKWFQHHASPCLNAAIRSEERRVGKSVSVRVDLGGRRIIKNQNKTTHTNSSTTTKKTTMLQLSTN